MRCTIYLLLLTGWMGLLTSCQDRSTTHGSGVSARDSIRVFQLFGQVYDVQNTNPDSAYALIRQAGELSRRSGFEQGMFNYYNQAMCNRRAYRSDFAGAKRLGDTALALVQDPARKRFRMLVNFSWAITHQLQKKDDSAIVYYLRALDNQPFTSDTSRVPMIQNNLTILFHFQQRDDLAVAYQLKSLKNALNAADTGRIIGGYMNLYGFEAARHGHGVWVSGEGNCTSGRSENMARRG